MRDRQIYTSTDNCAARQGVKRWHEIWQANWETTGNETWKCDWEILGMSDCAFCVQMHVRYSVSYNTSAHCLDSSAECLVPTADCLGSFADFLLFYNVNIADLTAD